MKLFNFLKKKERTHGDFTYNTVKIVESRSEVPDLPGNTLFLVRRGGIDKWLILECPGGHKRLIEVNLMKSVKPSWRISFSNFKKKISVYPSIAVMDNPCDCHFWIKENVVYKARFG